MTKAQELPSALDTVWLSRAFLPPCDRCHPSSKKESEDRLLLLDQTSDLVARPEP
jgi:hypothetical protein